MTFYSVKHQTVSKKCNSIKLAAFALILATVIFGGCSNKIFDYNGGYSLNLSDWEKIKPADLQILRENNAAIIEVLSADETAASFDVYRSPDNAILVVAVSAKLQKEPLNTLRLKIKEAQADGNTQKIHGIVWAIDGSDETGKSIYALYRKRHYSVFYIASSEIEHEVNEAQQNKLTDVLKKAKGIFIKSSSYTEMLETMDVKAFGFFKGIGNGIGVPIGVLRAISRTDSSTAHSLPFGFYLDKGADFAVYAKINNGVLYFTGFIFGIIISILAMDIFLLVTMPPAAGISLVIKLISTILAAVTGGNPFVAFFKGYVVPGLIFNGIFLWMAFIL